MLEPLNDIHLFSELEQCKYASNHREYSDIALLLGQKDSES